MLICLNVIVTQLQGKWVVIAMLFLCPNIAMGFHLNPCFLSPPPSKSFVFLNVPSQNEFRVWLWCKFPPDGLDVISPGGLAYRPNIQMSFYP